MYGAYRVLFRSIPGLTTGDGWTPAATALALADLVNDNFPSAARLKSEHFDSGTKWGHWSGGDEARYWIERGWQTALTTNNGFLPTPNNAVRKKLSREEIDLIKPALFGADSARLDTAEVLSRVKGATSHSDLCDALANSKVLSKRLGPEALSSFPAFSRFADAAMVAMRVLWIEINHDQVRQAPTPEKVARSSELKSAFDQLRVAGEQWMKAPNRAAFPHESVVTRLAEAMREAKNPINQLRALARHHHEYGGGRRWFREEAGKLVPLVADTGIAASDYRFRLRSLCRLAAQCGVADMNVALDILEYQELDDEEENL
jgi:hypothetical protein